MNGAVLPLSDPAYIERYAGRYWDLITSNDRELKRSIEREIGRYRALGYLDKAIFTKLALWKSRRNARRYEANPVERIKVATAQAFKARSDEAAVAVLLLLSGVALRTATALLHWMMPDRYPILDFRVVNALGLEAPRTWEDVGFYLEISERLCEQAGSLGNDLRTLDRALWAWVKAKNR